MPTQLRFDNGRPVPVDVCAVCGDRLGTDADGERVCPTCDPPASD
jgi:rubrerythrin